MVYTVQVRDTTYQVVTHRARYYECPKKSCGRAGTILLLLAPYWTQGQGLRQHFLIVCEECGHEWQPSWTSSDAASRIAAGVGQAPRVQGSEPGVQPISYNSTGALGIHRTQIQEVA